MRTSAATSDERRSDSNFKLALDNAERLSERNRLLLDVELARERGNVAAARRLLHEMLTKFPDLEEGYALAHQLHQAGEPPGRDGRSLLEITAAGVAVLPTSTHTRNAHGYALLGVGRYEDAVREFEAYARIAPREPNPHDSLGEAYLKAGEAEKAIEGYSRALAVDATFAPSLNMRAWSLATLGRYDAALAERVDKAHLRAMMLSRVGRYREAADVLAGGESESRAQGDATNAGGMRLAAALLALERGDHARALREIAAANAVFAGRVSEPGANLNILSGLMSGLAHIQAGRLPQALSEFDEQGRAYKGTNELDRAWRRSLEGEVALARGDLQQAASAFSASAPSIRIFSPAAVVPTVLLNDLPSRDGLARVAIARGDLDDAIKIYRDLLRYGPHSKWVAPYEPLYVLQIARLLEKKGDRKAALDEYQGVLNLWKNADADLRELTEARRAVARLNP